MLKRGSPSHILQEPNGSAAGHWGPYVLKSAFQPIYSFDGPQLKLWSVEGLIRPFRSGAPASPGAFFAAIPDADRLHVETLARDLHILNAGTSFGPGVTLFINFDPSLFGERAAVDLALGEVRDALKAAKLSPASVVCEVTEQPAGSSAALQRLVSAFKAEGFRVAVDDYGADCSDLDRVQQLKPDIIKFDAKWVGHLMTSPPGVATLRAMVSRFREQGIDTVFEGIEEGWQLDIAAEVETSMVQGFVLARPELAPTSFRLDARSATCASKPWHAAVPSVVKVEPAHASEAGRADMNRTPVRKPEARVFGRRVCR